MKNKKLLLILEYGIPNYRLFLFEYFNSIVKDFKIIHSGERFRLTTGFNCIRGFNFKLFYEVSFLIFNFSKLSSWDIVISTFNIRKPHTWLPIFFFTKPRWILWGQGLGRTRNRFILQIRKLVINRSFGYVAYNENVKDELIEFGIKPDKISVAYNTLKITNSEATFGQEYFLYVGRVQKRKGLEQVIRVTKRCNLKFLIVGDGPYLSVLRNLVKSLEVDNLVKFIDPVYDECKLKEIYSDAIAYVSPDHVGLGVVHSFAYGVPVVTCRNKAHAPEFIYCSHNNSFIYEKDNDLPNVMKKILDNKKLRNSKGRKAFLYYKEKLDHTNMINAFNYHFEKIQA